MISNQTANFDPIPVLDKGFVSLIDFLGGDLAVVQGARVSFGQETKGDERDRKLINYLMKHEHGTPFEMCLHGDTQIPTMPCPGATQKSYTMRQLAEAFEHGGKENSWVKLVKVRTVNPDGTISSTKIKRAWRTGHRPIYKITIDNRLERSILATSNHPFLTPTGYKQVGELNANDEVMLNGLAILGSSDLRQLWKEGFTIEEIGAILGTSRVTAWRKLQYAGVDTTRRSGFDRKDEVIDPRARARKRISVPEGARCEVCGAIAVDRHHVDRDIYNNHPANIMLVCRPCHKALDGRSYQLKVYAARVKSIEYAGEADVYDLEVESENHNFVANGFVVHNCVFKFHIKAPIFVARQWMRHRVGCLSGETLLHFDLPSGKTRGKSRLHKTSLRKLHDLWQEGSAHRIGKRKPLFLERVKAVESYTVTELARLVERRAETLHGLIRQGELCAARDEESKGNRPHLRVRGSDWHVYARKTYTARVPMRERIRLMNLRMCNEKTGVIEHTQIADIWQSGTKPVYRVTLENGYQIKMTEDHRCLTEQGWMTLKSATDLRRTASGAVVWNSDSPAFAANGESLHRNYEWLAARRGERTSVGEIAAQAGVSYHTIRKSLATFNLQYSPQERGRPSGDKQRGRKRGKIKRAPLSEKALRNIRAARSGARSNFWKGGVTSERANIARWTREQAARVHARYNFSCVICKSHRKLHAHHVAPVWHQPERARDFDNLTSLCDSCHRKLHARNLGLEFQKNFTHGGPLHDFWKQHSVPAPRSVRKARPTPTRLMRIYSPIAHIEYAGEEMTYDVEVTGPYHNFVANGFIVHNSYNEISYRYVEVEDDFYVPAELRAQDTKNKQASFGGAFSEEQNATGRALIETAYREAYEKYQKLLQMGVAREMARIVLPVGMYTQFYVAYNARSLMNFIRLRTGEGAQAEIRLYAEAMNRIFKERMPWTHAAFEQFVLKRGESDG